MSFLRKLHKWVGLLIGVQVFLWLVSGLVISLLDPGKVSGRYLSEAVPPNSPGLSLSTIIEPAGIQDELLAGVLEISLEMHLDTPVYRLRTGDGVTLINATDGTTIFTDKLVATSIAVQDYIGDGRVVDVNHGTAPDLETRNHTGGYWRVDFSDDVRTSIYVATADGRILERRNNYWRVRDVFWMLHIMDYRERTDFNHALVIIVALIAIWLGISGFLMLFGSFNRFDFAGVFGSGKLNTITLLNEENHEIGQLSAPKGANLLRILLENGLDIATICGGGGECGKCRVQLATAEAGIANPVETGLVPAPLRAKGFRLACQQRVMHDMTIVLQKNELPAAGNRQ